MTEQLAYKTFVRESICTRLYDSISYMDMAEEKTFHNIHENLQWLWATLKLDKVVSYSGGNNVVTLPPIAHNRQVNMLLSAIRYIADGESKEAYCKLCDLIDNYQQNYRDPFNNWELIAIKAVVEGILLLVKKELSV